MLLARPCFTSIRNSEDEKFRHLLSVCYQSNKLETPSQLCIYMYCPCLRTLPPQALLSPATLAETGINLLNRNLDQSFLSRNYPLLHLGQRGSNNIHLSKKVKK
jgi:hypothetical protein